MCLEGALGAHELGGVRLDECKPRLVQNLLGERLAVTFVQLRLGVKEIEMRGGPSHENINASLCRGFKVWLARFKRIGKFLG